MRLRHGRHPLLPEVLDELLPPERPVEARESSIASMARIGAFSWFAYSPERQRLAIHTGHRMLLPSSITEFVRRLRILHGGEFQAAIVTLLIRNITSFQAIPTKPSGDGGLDGLARNGEEAFCCYGLESTTIQNSSTSDISKSILAKFRDDLRKLFELKPGSKKESLLHKDNDGLGKILAGKTKIRHIYLVCNWFEDHSLVGKLQKTLDDCKAASKMRFVEADCTLSILGPNDVVAKWAVDDHILFIIENPEVAAIIAAKADPTRPEKPTNLSELEAKFEVFKKMIPQKAPAIDALKNAHIERWTAHLQQMEDLHNHAPNIHTKIQAIVQRATDRAELEGISGTAPASPAELIAQYQRQIAENLEHELREQFPPHLSTEFAQRVVSKLIGECPLDWR